MSAAWGVASAAAWGAGDFAGGLASRRAPVLRVGLAVQALGASLIVLAALAAREPLPSWRDAGWSALAGLGGGIGILSLYAALAGGRMGIAAPLSGLLAALLPVAVGLATEGAPKPTTLVGFVLAFAGVALVSVTRRERPAPRTLALAALSGLGFGAFLLAMSFTTGATFLWALVVARVAAGAMMLVMALARGEARGALPWRVVLAAAVLDALGNAFFLLATRAGRVDVAAILSSLYPAATVALARVVLGERLTWPQTAGSVLVLAAIALVAA